MPEPTAELVEQIAALGRGLPFAVNELARRAANEPRWVQALDANMIGGIAPATREVLQRVAVVGSSFDTDEFVALSGLPEDEAFDHLDDALGGADRRARERRATGSATASSATRCSTTCRRTGAAGSTATPPAASSSSHASPARIGHHLLAVRRDADAVPVPAAGGRDRGGGRRLPRRAGARRRGPARTPPARSGPTALSLRGDLLNAIGDPMAASAYREALDGADPARPGGCASGWRAAP